jgi:3(or 17)beta-hydroxysteroid dehydrogenase
MGYSEYINRRRIKMYRVIGKVALITGSASGIGKATAQLLAKEGAKVIVSDINVHGGREVANQIKTQGGEAIFIKLDVAIEDDWIKAIKKIVTKFGKLDILVNNAGIPLVKSIEATTLKDWQHIMSVNADGVFLGTKYAIGAMKISGSGSIINISSVAGMVGVKDASGYCASKGATRVFTKAAALECSKLGYDYNIRVNSIHPNSINTPMLEALDNMFKDMKTENDMKTRMENSIPVGRRGTAQEVAYAVLYLASDESTYITGAEISVDGGFLSV